MGTNVKMYFHGTKEEVAARQQRLRDLAKRMDYTAIAPNAGEGNIPALLEAIDAGEVTLLLLPPEQHGFVTDWLERQALALRESSGVRDNSIAEALETIVQALDRALERQQP
jgi:hypothetical protein